MGWGVLEGRGGGEGAREEVSGPAVGDEVVRVGVGAGEGRLRLIGEGGEDVDLRLVETFLFTAVLLIVFFHRFIAKICKVVKGLSLI